MMIFNLIIEIFHQFDDHLMGISTEIVLLKKI